MFDYYVKGAGAQPQLGATATIETCPSTARSGGPFSASTWAGLHPGEVDFSSPASQTILSAAGNPAISRADRPDRRRRRLRDRRRRPIRAPASPRTACPQRPATATRCSDRRRSSQHSGVTGEFPEIAARLWDVNPSTNTETLVARGRLPSRQSGGRQVFQLHPGAWHFAAGHIPKLELLGQDAPYARASNGSSRSRSATCSCASRCTMRPAARRRSGSRCPTRSCRVGTGRVCRLNRNVTRDLRGLLVSSLA